MIDICAEKGWLITVIRIQQLMQCIIQGRWYDDSPVLSLPQVDELNIPCFKRIPIKWVINKDSSWTREKRHRWSFKCISVYLYFFFQQRINSNPSDIEGKCLPKVWEIGGSVARRFRRGTNWTNLQSETILFFYISEPE